MINDEICKLRNQLNNSIAKGEDYDKIYRISVELDELISEYYITETIQKKEKSKKRNRKTHCTCIKRKSQPRTGCDFAVS